jgi:hypothetical protein
LADDAFLTAKSRLILDYEIDSRPRYGYGKPPHMKIYDLLNSRRRIFAENLSGFLTCYDLLATIEPVLSPEDPRPSWQNDWISGFDLISLCGWLKRYNSRQYMEIGSGNTTKFARAAIDYYHLPAKITSIDPCPRAKIDQLCDTVIRDRLENIELNMFWGLEAGDMIFMDGSHYTLMNSDASVFFLDILPNLPAGVVVGIHDIFLPFDYPPGWIDRYYSEQYLLAAYLLAEGRSFEILLANNFVATDPELSSVLSPLWTHLPWVTRHGAAFWIRKN